MQDRVTYEFAIIRLVPVVEREEFINIGVILFSKRKKFLDMRYSLDKEKLASFCGLIDVNLIEQYLKGWKDICLGNPDGGPVGEFDIADRFRWLAAAKSTMLQCSPTHPGLCDSPEKELEDLFNRYVL
jgi:hypothetical protein